MLLHTRARFSGLCIVNCSVSTCYDSDMCPSLAHQARGFLPYPFGFPDPYTTEVYISVSYILVVYIVHEVH